ncbi:MAG: phosphatase PAP2 family protein [Bacteroidetes bacterium]|nr:MAG: phosphatase PAP2 family protein [Bacteroidota bacterium]
MIKIRTGCMLAAVAMAIFCLWSCQPNTEYETKAANPEYLHRSMKRLTDVIVHDIFSPPVASRIYAYPSIAAYEALIHDYPEYQSMAGQLHELTELPQPEAGAEYCFPLASVHALLKTGKHFVFSEDSIATFEADIYKEFRSMMPASVYERSMAFGDAIAEHVIKWSDGDNYKQTRTFPKFTVNDQPGRWLPTPPDYMDGIEPHWNKIRPFIIDSATQFVPIRPTGYDMTPGSPFYQEVMEVYETGKQLDEEKKEIAQFWDCNPYVSHHQGHVMFATKKITPGGHWIGIVKIACQEADADMMKTAEAYARTAIALADAFISCWDEKYRSSLIRPETVINQHIDESWAPLLQTPPFPEYTSGHSVISSAAAVALTDLFGEPFHFIDSTEVEYGLPPREFNSFLEASSEAAISRLYGGIHYMPAIQNGVDQGKKVGHYVVAHLKTRKEADVAQGN